VAVKRHDLVAEFLGQTAVKTQKVIDRAMGCVLFIDEAYSLGTARTNGSRVADSYSMEAINTLNQNLSEHKGRFVTILAGYEQELEERFFAMNPGRFQYRFRIKGYFSKELLMMLFRVVKRSGLSIDSSLKESLIGSDFLAPLKPDLKCYGGDLHRLFFNIRIEHSRRVFGEHPRDAKKLSREDIAAGVVRYRRARQTEAAGHDPPEAVQRMYL